MSKLEEIKRDARARLEELEREVDLLDSVGGVLAEIEEKVRRELAAEYRAPWWVQPLIDRAVRARETGDVSGLPTLAEALCDFVWPAESRG